MTGVPSYSTTASENIQANTGINWDEGMPPASVNNSARQNMADMRLQWNDASWFQYGTGSKTTTIPVYASATSVTIAGIDVTTYWHSGRRVKAVGSGTGTIYGKVASSSFSTNTTVNFTWDSGSLSNEALTIYAGTAQVTGQPVPATSVAALAAADVVSLNTGLPAFIATNASAQSNFTGSGSNVQIVFGTEIVDRGSNFASNAFTAPVTGLYRFSFLVRLTGLTASQTSGNGTLITSNRTYRFSESVNASGLGSDFTVQGSMLADMDAADTAYIGAAIFGGVSDVVDTQGAGTCFFSGELVA